MTPEQQSQENGKMLERFAAAKKELAAVKSRSQTVGQVLIKLGNALTKYSFSSQDVILGIQRLPAREELQEIVEDAKQAQKTMSDISALVSQMGLKIE